MLLQPKSPVTRVASMDLSVFVKLTYLLIGCGAIAYVLIQMGSGGSLAAAADNASLGLVYAVGGLIVVFGVAVVGLAFRKHS